MSKRRFIQDVIIRSLPDAEKIDAAIGYAEWLWDQISNAGYGAPKQAKPREAVDYYAELTGFQKEWLDKFRSAYGMKYAPRNRTALAWLKLPEHTEAYYKRIIDAAKIEATLRTQRETTAPYAELWLNERRFEDLAKTAMQRKTDQNRTLKLELNSQLQALKQFNADGSNDDEIARIEAELESLK